MCTQSRIFFSNTEMMKYNMAHHQRVIEEFTTGEKLSLAKWWMGLPKLKILGGNSVKDYFDMDERGNHMVSWRAGNESPMFTLVYRGPEVDALHDLGIVDATERSRTILFSHATGECYVAKECIHLMHGDPMMLVQCIIDKTMISLHVMDVIVPKSSARDRAGVVQALGRCFGLRQNCTLGIMWCGDVTRHDVLGMLELRKNLEHTMSHVVILTDDPYVQIHLQVDRVEKSLLTSSNGKFRTEFRKAVK